MRKKVSIIVLLIIPLFAHSQDTIGLRDGNNNSAEATIPRHVNSISISIGLSIGGEQFINEFTSSIDRMGNGLNVNVFYSYNLSNIFGFGIKGYYDSNKFNGESYVAVIGPGIGSQLSYNNVYYNSYGLLTGPTLSFKILDELSISGCAFLGYAEWTKPETTFTLISNTNNGWIKMDKISSGAIIYNFGLRISFMLNENWDIFAHCDYIQGKFKFDENTLTMDDGSKMFLQEGSQKYGELNISIGLGFRF
jgi:hypothetical protein